MRVRRLQPAALVLAASALTLTGCAAHLGAAGPGGGDVAKVCEIQAPTARGEPPNDGRGVFRNRGECKRRCRLQRDGRPACAAAGGGCAADFAACEQFCIEEFRGQTGENVKRCTLGVLEVFVKLLVGLVFGAC